MTLAHVTRLIAGTVVGIASLGAATFSIVGQTQGAAVLASRSAQLVSPPVELLPPGTRSNPPASALNLEQRASLAAAIWRVPLDAKLFNLFYADQVRANSLPAAQAHYAMVLGALGWRYSQAQQNLILRAALNGRLADVVDRVDSLLRRQKMTEYAFLVLSLMEAAPESHSLVVGKLQANPPWRRDYLAVISARSAPALVTMRVHTIQTLLQAHGRVSRDEIAPSLTAMIETGRERDAYDLWTRYSGNWGANDVIADGRFVQAAKLSSSPAAAIPFEWQLQQGFGYSTEPTGRGVTINWDQRGMPTFLSQVVPLKPGNRYELMINGSVDAGQFGNVLQPSIGCHDATVYFTISAAKLDYLMFISDAIPSKCDMGVLAIGGRTNPGTGNLNAIISQIRLRLLADR